LAGSVRAQEGSAEIRTKSKGRGGSKPLRRHRINEEIQAPKIRLIAENGEQLGIKPLSEALETAAKLDLDLVEVAPMADPPVCRLMDYGKYLYEESQRAREARKHQTHIVIKEMKFRPKIDRHDYETKIRHVARFLEDGAKVRISVMFRGRELAHPELGERLLEKIVDDLEGRAVVEQEATLDGRNMVMLLAPATASKRERRENA
jgi:translation initiation factor IF-3